MNLDWSLILNAVSSIATAVAALFAWRSARVAAHAAREARELANLEKGRRDDELRIAASNVYLTVQRSDTSYDARQVTVRLCNSSPTAVKDVLVDLTGSDSLGRSRTWRNHEAVLPGNTTLENVIDFSDQWEPEESEFPYGADIGFFVWKLWFTDAAGRHWCASDRGAVILLPEMPPPRSADDIIAELGLEAEYAERDFATLWLSRPGAYPDLPEPEIQAYEDPIPIREWPAYAVIRLRWGVGQFLNRLRERW